MKLCDLKKGESATITAINADKELKKRFNSFGIVKGVTIHAEQHTITKQTMEVRIKKTRMALRLTEAEKVEISQ